VENPEWKGSLFDFCEESPTIAIASTLCLPCVLGWNLDRLGLGNRYVHVITFILLCSAPFLVFDIAAINVNNLYAYSPFPHHPNHNFHSARLLIWH
jgi:hypothetical protein